MIDRKDKILGIMGSILVHLVILISIIRAPESIPTRRLPLDEPESIQITLIPMPSVTESKADNSDADLAATYPTDSSICAGQNKTYVGVGFIMSFGSDLIIHIPEFYPAYKAGMRLGDFILNPYEPIINGWIDFDVLRHTEKLHFHIKADNICFNEG
jgi:membrane-associated protease RseP (regulator of RpoE activity)